METQYARLSEPFKNRKRNKFLFLVPAIPFPLPIKEAWKSGLAKNIGGPPFDIYIHFIQTSRETFPDKVVRLIRNEPDDVTE